MQTQMHWIITLLLSLAIWSRAEDIKSGYESVDGDSSSNREPRIFASVDTSEKLKSDLANTYQETGIFEKHKFESSENVKVDNDKLTLPIRSTAKASLKNDVDTTYINVDSRLLEIDSTKYKNNEAIKTTNKESRLHAMRNPASNSKTSDEEAIKRDRESRVVTMQNPVERSENNDDEVIKKDRVARLFALQRTTSRTVIVSSTLLALSTCISQVNGQACIGRKRKRSLHNIDHFS